MRCSREAADLKTVQRPSVTGIIAWSNARFGEHRAALFGLGLVAAIVPLARLAIGHEQAPERLPSMHSLTTIAHELVVLLCTAAMVLVVIRPKEAPAFDAVREAVADAPRLVLVKIATALVRWLPSLMFPVVAFGLRSGEGAIIIWLLLVPLGFICQLAFASAVIERSGPVGALEAAFRRARVCGLPIVFGLSAVFAVVEYAPTAIFAFIANAIYPPADVPITFPAFPGIDIPPASFPVFTRPGEFGSAIPWGIHIVMLLANVPFVAYLTVLYAGAALSFADADPSAAELAGPLRHAPDEQRAGGAVQDRAV